MIFISYPRVSFFSDPIQNFALVFSTKKMYKIAVPILLVGVYASLMVLAAHYLKSARLFSVSPNAYLNYQFNYQLVLLVITAVSLTSTFLLNKQNFSQHFRMGSISAQGKELKLFGMKANDSWLKTGISLALVISMATAVFMFFQLKEAPIHWGELQSGLFWIILFSLSNSFGEEMVFRMGIVSPLKGLLKPMTMFILSAILFGIPHFAGIPSGVIGVTMAGVLGLVLAKSLYETKGFFWAWTIHFLQDVLIIGTLFLMSAMD